MAEEDLNLTGEEQDDDAHELRDDAPLQRSYKEADASVCGALVELEEGFARTELETMPNMAVDKEGLVHGGFVFSGGNYAAMVAINNPYAVVIGAEVKFLAPIEVGNVIEYEAKVLQAEAKKREIRVIGTVMDIKVFDGVFYVAIFEKHIFRIKLS